MSTNTIYDAIKRTVHSILPGSRVVLFGSRARGNEDKQSDYDLLIITRGALTQTEKSNWSSKLNKAIVKAIHIPVDLLIYSEEEINQKQILPGHIVRSAMREGISL